MPRARGRFVVRGRRGEVDLHVTISRAGDAGGDDQRLAGIARAVADLGRLGGVRAVDRHRARTTAPRSRPCPRYLRTSAPSRPGTCRSPVAERRLLDGDGDRAPAARRSVSTTDSQRRRSSMSCSTAAAGRVGEAEAVAAVDARSGGRSRAQTSLRSSRQLAAAPTYVKSPPGGLTHVNSVLAARLVDDLEAGDADVPLVATPCSWRRPGPAPRTPEEGLEVGQRAPPPLSMPLSSVGRPLLDDRVLEVELGVEA